MAEKRDIKYLNRDFSSFKQSLIDYTKTYFPTTYNDFTETSPGMLFMEMASYVGDVLSFYLDNQIQETYLQYARQNNNLYELAYMFGYKPKVTGVASCPIDFYQLVPANNGNPDFSYTLTISENATITSPLTNLTSSFLVEDSVNFAFSSSTDPTNITVYSIDGSGNPLQYLLKKTRNSISANINTTTFTFTTPEKFSTVEINAPSIIGILDITDSDGNPWYEVDYLGQETIFKSIQNTNPNDPNYYSDSSQVPYLLNVEKVQRRFSTRFLDSGSLQIQFGAGTVADRDEDLVPNPTNVGLGLPFEKDKLTTAYDPSNFIFTDTYGIAPSNTTLTVRYLTGGGVTANYPANSLTQFGGVAKFNNTFTLAQTGSANEIFTSLQVTNPIAASGGKDGDSISELRQNTISNFGTQLRNVTSYDYIVRSLSMPPKYGTVAKAYIEPTKAQTTTVGEANTILDLYISSYNANKNLVNSSTSLKQNLSTYLSQYRMIGDVISIKDAFIINIGVNFEIVILPEYNSNIVIANCLLSLRNFFDIDKWQINQPIILKDISVALDQVEGVQTVKSITITNKAGTSLGYSEYAYDTEGATLNGVIYPSLDPMIFEVKYPDTDIQGRVVTI